ncbi:hypothetical protein QNO07_21295 [Streptomyces sp. 549]|nr:hypothetical protein [Streptomyces sp. 549]MDK1475919.1 hypothetical protein [Streptomyces sp. 549]
MGVRREPPRRGVTMADVALVAAAVLVGVLAVVLLRALSRL